MTGNLPQASIADCVAFVSWMERRLLLAGRGDEISTSTNKPDGQFWLGRLAPEDQINSTSAQDRLNRMEPCAIGIRVLLKEEGPWTFDVRVRMRAWIATDRVNWNKSPEVDETIRITATDAAQQTFGAKELQAALKAAVGSDVLRAEIRIEIEESHEGLEMLIQVVNTSPMPDNVPDRQIKDRRLYEVSIAIDGLDTDPYMLEALPDSFRYDRRVPAYGVNCGVQQKGTTLSTTDTITAERARPKFWGSRYDEPSLTFEKLEADPFPDLELLVSGLRKWGDEVWSSAALDDRAAKHGWSGEMRAEAGAEAKKFEQEYERIADGLIQLRSNSMLLRSFSLMNRSMKRASAGRGYSSWRPFQVGFILANLSCIVEPTKEADVVDIVWFATGGGKTETYLGLLVTAALYDRMRGKSHGVTAWTRFPLRLLSLQQLQRFADAMAAAEMVRREENIGGDVFATGFLVGDGATPNRIPVDPKPDAALDIDKEDETTLRRFKRLQKCPFCSSRSISMNFDRDLWRLNHVCENADCVWPEKALPFHIVDEEVYRFLPTIIVGTLDKAASIGMQGAMRGLAGPPIGLCPRPGHGFTYVPRSARPHGCFVPGCKQAALPLPTDGKLFGPSYRLQDELHLLRDSLGAVDAHYEALFDGLEEELCGNRPKILASSATLQGYEGQIDVLYRRAGRVFPQQGPSIEEGFWTASSDELMRKYVAIAPRGLTIEYVIDRMATEMQNAVRLLISNPDKICKEIGVDVDKAASLIALYGTQVIYGNTLRDLDAVQRSIQSGQIRPDDGKPLNTENLTGRTDFENVAKILERLEKPEDEMDKRIHLITASSMMSHGVDIDRLNVMVMAGIPLGSAEFIQATARVGRRYPGLVFVIHKIGRERDASVFRSFEKFVLQGDRFIEPIPITRKSRRVLERTIAGLEMARILAIHEPAAKKSLAKLGTLKNFLRDGGFDLKADRAAIMHYLGLSEEHDAKLVADLNEWFDQFERNLVRPTPNMEWGSDACPTGAPMRSLRDVEEQVPLYLDRRP